MRIRRASLFVSPHVLTVALIFAAWPAILRAQELDLTGVWRFWNSSIQSEQYANVTHTGTRVVASFANGEVVWHAEGGAGGYKGEIFIVPYEGKKSGRPGMWMKHDSTIDEGGLTITLVRENYKSTKVSDGVYTWSAKPTGTTTTHTFHRMGVATGLDPNVLRGTDGAAFSFRILGTHLRLAGQGGAPPQARDVSLLAVDENGVTKPSGLVVEAAALQDADGSVLVSGRYRAATGPVLGEHRVKLVGAAVAGGKDLVLTVKSASLDLVKPSNFCLVGHTREFTAEVPEGVDPGPKRVRWRLEPAGATHKIAPDSSEPGARRHAVKLTAGPVSETVTLSAGLAEASPAAPDVEHRVHIWSLTSSDDRKDRRVGPVSDRSPDRWNSFSFILAPAAVSITALTESGRLRLSRLDAPPEAKVSSWEFAFQGVDNQLEFEDSRLADYVLIQPDRILWNGKLPDRAVEEEDVDGERRDVPFEPGKYRLDFFLKNGDHEASISHEFILDTVSRLLDLTGHFRVEAGPAKGWILKGRSHGGGKVSLDSAPGVALSGTWDKPDYGAKADLVQGGGVDPFKYQSELRTAPPAVLTALKEARLESPTLEGKPEGFPGNRATFKRGPWRVDILEDRSTLWFDPERGKGEGGSASDGLKGGRVAQVRFDRAPEPLVGQRGDKVEAVARVLDIEEREIEKASSPLSGSPPEGRLTVDVAGRWVHGLVNWTGLKADGTPHPPGAYFIELIVREGMAEQKLRRKVLLGNSLRITEVPPRFALGREDLPIKFEWQPAETPPRTLYLSVKGGNEELVKRRQVLATDKTKVLWTAAEQIRDVGDRDWTRLLPFKIVLTAVSPQDQREVSDAAELTVVATGFRFEVKVPESRTEDERRLYGENEVPVDRGPVTAETSLKLLTSGGREVDAPDITKIAWKFTVDTAHDPARQTAPGPALLDRQTVVVGGTYKAGAGRIEGEGTFALKDGRASLTFRTPINAEREDWGGRIPIRPDRFKIEAAVVGMEERGDFRGMSKEYTMACGAPASVTQVPIERLTERWGGPDSFATELRDGRQYVDTLLAKAAVGLHGGNPVSDTALRAMFGSFEAMKVRYMGRVRNVPYRSALGITVATGAADPSGIDVYLAGFAGAPDAELRAGQALLVMVEVLDRYGNPVPTSGERARPLQIKIRDNKGGNLPPHVLEADDRTTQFDFNAELAYSPYWSPRYPERREPLGVHGFYYVPGISIDTRLLREEINRLELAFKSLGDEDKLKTPITTEVDNRVRVEVLWEGRVAATLQDVRLAKEGSRVDQVTAAIKLLKWLVAGEVSDVQTFKLEVALSTIPIVGDGRDLVIYLLKNAFGSELSGWDHLFAGIALIGLIGDLGDIHPLGIAVNATIASIKAAAKRLKQFYGWTSNATQAFVKTIQPLIDAARAMSIADAPKLAKLIEQKLGQFLVLMTEAIRKGDPQELLKRIFDFVNTCNPQKCFKLFCLLEPGLARKFLDYPQDVRHALDQLARKINDYEDGKLLQNVFENLRRVGDAMAQGGQEANASLRHLAEILEKFDDVKEIRKVAARLGGASDEVLASARDVFSRDGFLKAAQGNRGVFDAFIDAVTHPQTGRDAARVFSRVAETAEDFGRLVRVMRQMDELVPALARLVDDTVVGGRTVFDRLGGVRGAQDVIHVLGELLQSGGGDGARATLRICEDIRLVIRTGEDVTALTHLRGAYDQLFKLRKSSREFATYMECMDYFRKADGSMPPGLVTQAVDAVGDTRGASRNLVRVASGVTDEALEVVGTWHMVARAKCFFVAAESKVVDKVLDKELASLAKNGFIQVTKENVQSFGFKGVAAVRGARPTTFEADVLIQVGNNRFFMDWKNFSAMEPSIGTLKAELAMVRADAGIARELLVDHVVYMSPKRWAQKAVDEVRNLPMLLDEAGKALFPMGRRILLGQLSNAPDWDIVMRFVR